MSKLAPKYERCSDTFLVNEALSHHFAAETTSRQAVAHAALSGLALKTLKKQAGPGNWLDFHAAHFDERLSERLAQKYMLVAEGLRAKAKDLPQLDSLLATPAAQFTDSQRERLAGMVEEITDGETMASLIEAYRITKPRPDPVERGGYQVDEEKVRVFLRAYHPALVGTPYAELSPEVQEHFRKWVVAGERDGEQAALDFWQPVFDAFEHRDLHARFAKLPVTEKQRLRDHLAAVVDRLNQELGR